MCGEATVGSTLFCPAVLESSTLAGLPATMRMRSVDITLHRASRLFIRVHRYTANEDCSEANGFKYKMKGDQCLPYCVGIGGEATFDDACTNHGMFDAGPAHDAAFCCTTKQRCGARTPPTCEDTGSSGDDDSSMTMIIAIVGVSGHAVWCCPRRSLRGTEGAQGRTAAVSLWCQRITLRTVVMLVLASARVS
jgi:hypothetical protein